MKYHRHQPNHPQSQPPAHQRGFTLIELLLYVAISAVIMTGIVALLILLMTSRIRNQTVTEVESQGAFVMQELGQSIRNATSLTSPLPGASGNTLVLTVADSTKSPTTYTLTNGVLAITEGNGKAVTLNSPAVTVSNLTFQNLSLAGTTSQIMRVSFTVSYVNKTGRDEYNYSKTFYNSYSLR